jgi:dimethylglycine dehydrogenase
MAQGYVPKNIADDDSGWSVELLGRILTAKRQKFSLFDANASRMRS